MDCENYTLLLEQLKSQEGFRKHVYLCTAGKQTIGYGWNIEEGIDEEVAEFALSLQMKRAEKDAKSLVSPDAWAIMGPVRQCVLVNMAFNLGKTRLGKFVNMLKALEDRNYPVAALEMMDSRWSKQVGQRAIVLRDQLLKGQWD